jgi:sugar phosphate isomerase/epimerase
MHRREFMGACAGAALTAGTARSSVAALPIPAGANLIEKLEKNIDLVGLVHVADVPGRHHPGTGEINYSTIFRKLAELRYSRYVAMEFKPLGDAVKELRDARELAVSGARSARVARSFESGRKYESA